MMTETFWQNGLESNELKERQHTYGVLGNKNLIGDQTALSVLMSQVAALQKGEIPETDRLDLVETMEKWSEVEEVNKSLNDYRASFDQNVPGTKYRDSLVGGSGQRGSDIFWNRVSVYCQRCHQIGNGGGAVGPNLSDIGLKKDRQYLLESIVDPNKAIAENFETTVILDLDGNTLSGIVQKETDEFVQIIDVDAKVTTIDKEDIEARRKGASAMPLDLIKNLSPRDIRDLVEFLANQKTAPSKGTVIPEGHK